ncbi:MAG: hypothetical protein KC502_18115 [Myxococcales bacterium]|nr:hypothetical protein [Myxococcales bacterium]
MNAIVRPTHHTQPSARRPTGLRLAPFVLAAALALPTSASALTVLQVSLPQLVDTSTYVLHGKVVASRVLDKRAKGLAVFTETTLAVKEVYKGDRKLVGKTFSWEMIGGSTKDGLTWSVPGMPTFGVGEEVVVLLEKHARGFTITGAPQGKFSIFRDKKNIARVRRRLGDVHFMKREPKSGRIVSAPHAVKPVLLTPPSKERTLMSLRAQIKGIVASQLARKAAKAKAATQIAVPVARSPVGKRRP